MAQLSFYLVVWYQSFRLVLDILFPLLVAKEPVAVTAHLFLVIFMINKIRLRTLLSNIIILVNRHNCVLLCLHPHVRVVLGFIPRERRLHVWIRVDVTESLCLFETLNVSLELLGNLLELLVDVPGRIEL